MAQPQANGNIKVLSVVWYKVLPPKFGGQKAVALFNEFLGRYVEVVCVCSKNNSVVNTSYKIDASLPVSKTQFLNPLVWLKIYRVAKQEKCTHLILEFPYHGVAAIICKKLLGIKLIVDTHNIEYLRFKQQKKWWARLLYHFEKWTLKNCDAVFFKTDADKTIGVKRFGLYEQKIAIISYGVEQAKNSTKEDTKEILRHRHDIEKDKKLILFAGTLDYLPNAEAVLSIVKDLVPSLNKLSFKYKIIICGRNRLKGFEYLRLLQNENTIFAGEVADIETYFLAADVFINPVLMGSGIQTKTMDALSYHLNVVCFKNMQGEINHVENKLFQVENGDWTAFAKEVLNASKRCDETQTAFFTTYNWDAIANTAYKKIAAL